jgi:hypothetical protein
MARPIDVPHPKSTGHIAPTLFLELARRVKEASGHSTVTTEHKLEPDLSCHHADGKSRDFTL